MNDLSIRTKLLLAIAGGLLVAGLVSVSMVRSVSERNMQTASEQALRTAQAVYAGIERGDVEKLSALVDALATRPDLREAFVARDREKLQALAAPLFARLKADHKITHWYFHEPGADRTCFLRVHKPQQFGDRVDRVTLSKAIDSARLGAGKELGKTAFALRVVKPYDLDGQRLGYLELGEEIDSFLGTMKAQTGDDYALLIGKKFLDEKAWAAVRAQGRNNWGDLPDAVLVDSTAGDGAGLSLDVAAVPADGKLLGELEQGEHVVALGAFPVTDAGGRQVGALVVRHDVSALHASMAAGRLQLTLVILLLSLVVAVLVMVLLDRLVFRRLARMMATMEDLSLRVAGGDYEVGASVQTPASQDEIGRFEGFFGQFLGTVATGFRALLGKEV